MARSPQVHVLIAHSYNAAEFEVTGLAGSDSYRHRKDQQGQSNAMTRQQMRENRVARAKKRRNSTVPAVKRETCAECGAWVGAGGDLRNKTRTAGKQAVNLSRRDPRRATSVHSRSFTPSYQLTRFLPPSALMEHWKNFTASVSPIGQRLSERFGALVRDVATERVHPRLTHVKQNQQARERFGHADDLTELPEEYKQLEQRVDALKNAHQSMMRYV